MKATAPRHTGQPPRRRPSVLIPARTATGGGAAGRRGHPALMTIGRSEAGYRSVRSRDDALRPMGPDAELAWRLLRDIKAAWRDAPRGQKDAEHVPYTLERAMRAARVGKHAVGGISYRERIARMLRWLATQETIEFAEGDHRWSILLRTTPAAVQYNPLGEWRHESQRQASELLVLWQRLWQERWGSPYRWPPERLVFKDEEPDHWVNELADSHDFLAAQLDCGVAPELISQVYLGYIAGQVQWKVTASPIRIHNSFKWHGGRPKRYGLTTCHAHFDRLLHDVRAAIDLQARALDQEPPLWLYEQPDEVDRRVMVTSAKIIRRAKRLRAAGKPAPTDEQARAIAVRRNQPKGTVMAPRGSDHLYEAATARRGRCSLHGDRPKANCAECQPTFPN